VRCLKEASTLNMSFQLQNSFAMILNWCNPMHPKVLCG
jgi:hypothetical protein